MCSSSSRRTTSARTCPAHWTACAPTSPTPTSWSSTTAHRTAPASSPRRSPSPRRSRPTSGTAPAASTSCIARASSVSARRTSPDSAGRWSAGTTSSWRWTPTGPTVPRTFPGCSLRSRTRTSCSARGGCPVGACSTGRSAATCSPAGPTPTRGSCSASRCGTRPAASARTAQGCSGASAWTTSRRRATASRSTWPGARSAPGARVVEVPITFVERELGQSKMSRAIVVEALFSVTRWGIAERSRRLAGAFRRSGG